MGGVQMTSDDPTAGEPPSREVRFVVLRHCVSPDDVHFDLMIDAGDALATWRCPEAPDTAADVAMTCEKLADHRRRYLEYEGPLSQDRGEVRQHDGGYCRLLAADVGVWRIEFRGTQIRGHYELASLDQDRRFWSLRPQPPR